MQLGRSISSFVISHSQPFLPTVILYHLDPSSFVLYRLLCRGTFYPRSTFAHPLPWTSFIPSTSIIALFFFFRATRSLSCVPPFFFRYFKACAMSIFFFNSARPHPNSTASGLPPTLLSGPCASGLFLLLEQKIMQFGDDIYEFLMMTW